MKKFSIDSTDDYPLEMILRYLKKFAQIQQTCTGDAQAIKKRFNLIG
jgi:hypothetical protein